jgi:hypothetical protein
VRLKAHPPDAVLVTDQQWPPKDGFQALDDWPEFVAQLACCYIALYSRRAEPWLCLELVEALFTTS